jgi:hypothetical protein
MNYVNLFKSFKRTIYFETLKEMNCRSLKACTKWIDTKSFIFLNRFNLKFKKIFPSKMGKMCRAWAVLGKFSR